jgi:hypothetical protein
MNLKRTLAGYALTLTFAAGAFAQPAQSAKDPDDAIKDDIVTAYKILVNEGILDSFGHVSARSAKNPNVFLMPRAMPPALVTKDDILEVNVADSQPLHPRRNLQGSLGCDVGHSCAFPGCHSHRPDIDQDEAGHRAGGLPAARDAQFRDS